MRTGLFLIFIKIYQYVEEKNAILKEKNCSKARKRAFLKQKSNYFDIVMVSETQSQRLSQAWTFQ
jgi:hypothetical protein